MDGRLVGAVVALIVAIFTVSTPISAAATTNVEFAHSYTYDGILAPTELNDENAERGPPVWGHAHIDTAPRDAVDHWWSGPSARMDATTPRAKSTYDAHSALVEVARFAATTEGQLQVADADHVVFDRPVVAAKSVATVGGHSLDDLSRAAGVVDRNGLSGAGRALQSTEIE